MLEDLPLEQWKSVVDTNLTGTFMCAKFEAARPSLIPRRAISCSHPARWSTPRLSRAGPCHACAVDGIIRCTQEAFKLMKTQSPQGG